MSIGESLSRLNENISRELSDKEIYELLVAIEARFDKLIVERDSLKEQLAKRQRFKEKAKKQLKGGA